MQNGSWQALSDVVGALMSAIRLPACPAAEGPSQEERHKG
jgi:hypothetical protein